MRGVELVDTLKTIYGKRIIIMGGGAQVGQVAIGAISEADRHNIRGERISVDTIPLVGEENLAGAVRAVARLPRAVGLVLAGALGIHDPGVPYEALDPARAADEWRDPDDTVPVTPPTWPVAPTTPTRMANHATGRPPKGPAVTCARGAARRTSKS